MNTAARNSARPAQLPTLRYATLSALLATLFASTAWAGESW